MPDGLAQTLQQSVQCFVRVAESGRLLFEDGADPRWRVDRELFEQGHMQREMQHRVHGALFGRPFAGDRGFRIIEQRVVFRVQGDDVRSDGFGAVEGQTFALLAARFAEVF